MNYGLERLNTLPLSLRLIREIHEILLKGVRGSDRNPGFFRKSQNWIGGQGCTLSTAVFVPPPAEEMQKCMNELEKFFYYEKFIPPLIKIALIHAQFETIHPFLDGNGRVGRLLITFWLCEQKILSRPMLYLSYYFKQNRTEYYSRLMDIRFHGEWENWIKFFLRGISFVSLEAADTASSILIMQEKYSSVLSQIPGNAGNYRKLLDSLFETPVTSRKKVSELLNISSPAAGILLDTFCRAGILDDSASEYKQRKKKFYFREYLELLEK